MDTVRLALDAMNTRFELVLHGEYPVQLRAAGEEALTEISRIEAILSAFRTTSEIALVNSRAAREPVRVSPEVLSLMAEARRLWEVTGGLLDVTIGPLIRCWGFWGASGALPDPSDVARAMDRVGMQHVELDPEACTVRFRREGMAVDLGSIGKGYAIDQAIEILRENGVKSALLHGGTSTAYGIGCPPTHTGWTVSVAVGAPGESGQSGRLPPVEIQDEALSTSSVSEKSFRADDTTYGHVMDPRTGWPVQGAILSMVSLPTAMLADAWSTALLVMGVSGLSQLGQSVPGLKAMVMGADGVSEVVGFGEDGSALQ